MKTSRLPASWKLASMSDVAANTPHSLAIGPFGSDLKTSDFVANGVPVVFVRNVRPNKFKDGDRKFVSRDKAEQLSAHRVRAGDLIVTKMGLPPCVTTIYPGNAPDGIVTADIIKLTADLEKVDPRFVCYYLNSIHAKAQVERFTFGVTRPKVTLSAFRSLEIPLPPLSEQKRIADILDKADAIRRKRQEAVGVDELIKAIFFDMFGDPLVGTESEPVSFTDLTNRITYGFTCPMDHVESGVPIITGKNVRDGFIDFENVHYARQDQFDALTAKSKPVRGDILIIKDGAIRGRCAILETSSPICINQSVCLVQPNHDRVTPEFLYGYLSSIVVRRKINEMDKGVAMPHLQITELAKFPVRLPSLRKQQTFSKRFRQALTLADRVSESMSNLDDLFNSLVQRAFKGQL